VNITRMVARVAASESLMGAPFGLSIGQEATKNARLRPLVWLRRYRLGVSWSAELKAHPDTFRREPMAAFGLSKRLLG
jgi:hypothetical protein